MCTEMFLCECEFTMSVYVMLLYIFNLYVFKEIIIFHYESKFSKMCQKEADSNPLKQVFNLFCFDL